MAERRLDVNHAGPNRWRVRSSPYLAKQARLRTRPTGSYWRTGKTCVKVFNRLIQILRSNLYRIMGLTLMKK